MPRAMHNCRRPTCRAGKSDSISAAVHTAVRAGIKRIHFIAPICLRLLRLAQLDATRLGRGELLLDADRDIAAFFLG